jgi:diguanylate cyclase (GGDEF)-like protein/PAS domain S-box-containing protein
MAVDRDRPTDAGPKYPEMLDRVPAIIYVADAGEDGRWRYVSPQIQSILGYSPEEWCADPTLWASRLHPEDRQRVLAREASRQQGSDDSSATEYRMCHRDGRAVWIRDDARFARGADGTLRWHGVLSDISEQKQVEAKLEQRAAQQSAVARLGEHALEGLTIGELMQEAVSGAAEMLDLEIAAVLEYLPDESILVLRSGIGWPPSALGRKRFPVETASQSGYTLETMRPVIVSDWRTEERFRQSPELAGKETRSGLTVIIDGPDRPFGVLGVQSLTPRDFGPDDIDFLQSLANVLADALQRQTTEDRIRHRALHDALTGLPNRVLFLDRLEHALARLRRRDTKAAILFLDFDRFKLINDNLGHQVGDELLAAAAPRLRQAVRASDTVARFGGDEFGILLEDISGEREAVETAERIASVFTRPFVLAGSEHFVTTSIGIALAQGGELPEELIRDADAAMYRAKERGRARYELFDEVMRVRAIARLRVENDLRQALERDELGLVYQPLVSLIDRSIIGVEALLRWEHPRRGLILPSEFIPVAEEDGLIEPIGVWVLERACRQAADWHQLRPDAAPIGMSVNLSAVQVANRNFPGVVARVLRATGLDPASLSLEITESVMLRDAESPTEALPALKALGLHLILDDFGTGYSSLGYLTRLPIDAVKIDRSFVNGLGTESRDSAITEAVIAMSNALSLQVIAEGVETTRQATELSRLGCGLAQGFLFSPPLPAAEITRLLEAGHGRLPAPRGA